jgi:hypothetical protein
LLLLVVHSFFNYFILTITHLLLMGGITRFVDIVEPLRVQFIGNRHEHRVVGNCAEVDVPQSVVQFVRANQISDKPKVQKRDENRNAAIQRDLLVLGILFIGCHDAGVLNEELRFGNGQAID